MEYKRREGEGGREGRGREREREAHRPPLFVAPTAAQPMAVVVVKPAPLTSTERSIRARILVKFRHYMVIKYTLIKYMVIRHIVIKTMTVVFGRQARARRRNC